MKFRKVCILLTAISSLLCSCKDDAEDNRKTILANPDYLLYGNVSENNYFYTPTAEEFDGLYASGLNFIIFFDQEGCSACQQFAPIMKKYIEETHAFVVSISGPDEYKIKENYKYTFFDDGNFLTPSVFIKEENNEIFKVDYSSYMRTYYVFKKHMNERYKISKYAYFTGEIDGKSSIISEFTKVEFISFGAFKTLIKPKVEQSKKCVILSLQNFNKISSFSKNENGDFSETKSLEFNSETTEEQIASYF